MADDKNETHYFLDGNPDELDRLNLGQEVIKDCMGKLVFAPLDLNKEGLRVLDSATANGIWLQDLRASLPQHVQDSGTFVGTDITGIYFPQPTPPGLSLLEQSMTKPWPEEWNGTFDLFHQRMALPAAPTALVLPTLKSFIGLLKPGGWVQLVEPDHSYTSGPVMAEFYKLLSSIFTFMETSSSYAPKLATWLAELGLQDVQEKVFDVPVGKSNEKEELRVKSARMQELVSKGLVEVAKGAGIETGLEKEQLESLPRRLKEEVQTSGGVFRLHVVWGRKALEE